MDIDIVEVPYDSGFRDWRMGAGPGRLIDASILPELSGRGVACSRQDIRLDSAVSTELASAFALQRLTAGKVAAAKASRRFPIDVSGNCNYAAVGAIAGLDDPDVAVLWLDAHGDCETPDTTESAFLDGMGLAMLMHRCWRARLSAVPGFRAVAGSRVVLAGARQLSAAELSLLEREAATHVPVHALTKVTPETVLLPIFSRWREDGVRRLYIHVDLDVLDPSIVRANSYAEPNGWSLEQVCAIIDVARGAFSVAAAALTAYDPACDPDGRMLPAAAGIAGRLAATV